MYSMEADKQEDLSLILQKLSTKNKDVNKEKPDLSEIFLYDTSKNREEKVQKVIHKFVAHDMNERLDLYLFLELIQTLHNFNKGIQL